MADTPITLSPEQEAEFNRQVNTQPASQTAGAIDPLKDFTPEQLVSLSTQDPDNFSIANEFANRPDIQKDPALVSKVANAYSQLKDRGFKLADLPGPGKIAGTLWDTAKGFGKQAWNYASAASIPFSALYGKLAGEPDQYYAELAKQAQRGIAENWAGTESAVTSLAGQAQKAGRKIGGMLTTTPGTTPAPKSEQEKVQDLFNDAAMATQQKEISKGKGEFMQAVGNEVVPELGIRPEEVQKLAAGDPFSWYAMGKVFGAAGEIPGTGAVTRAGERVAEKAGELATQAGGKTLETGADLTAAGLRAVAKPLPVAGAIIGATKGALEHGPIIGGFAGYKAGQALAKGAKSTAAKLGELSDIGTQIAEQAPVKSNLAQLGKDVLQAAPGAALDVAKGAGFDIGLAAATAETPEDTRGIGFGTAFGALGAGRRLGGRVLSGQIIAPRDYGVRTTTVSSGQFPTLDAMHTDAVRTAPPGVITRLNAIRAFAKGVAPNTDIYLAKDPASAEQALKSIGYSDEDAAQAANSEGFFGKAVTGRDGTTRNVIIANNIDAAPHEAFHAIQDVIGESGNRALDEQIKQAYGQNWEQIGKKYASDLSGPQGDNWRESILDASGWGRAEAAEKIYQSIYNDSKSVSTGEPDPDQVRRVANSEWLRLVSEAKQRNPGLSLDEAQNAAWRDVLSPSEATNVADRYVAREIAAENFDAAFKSGGENLQPTGFLPKAAKVVANLISTLGGEPLAGRTSENLNLPLNYKTVQGVREAIPAKPEIQVEPKAPEPARPVIQAGMPATQQDQQVAAEEARTLSEQAPTAPVAGGTKSPRELLGQIAEAIAQRSGVKLNYLSAPDEPAAAITSNRANRRSLIEAFRNMPVAARSLWEKTFFPERVLKTKNDYQVLGWSPEVFAANAHKTAQLLSDLQAKGSPITSPYELDPANRTFTAQGWQELYNDVQRFVSNQIGGRTGAGEQLVVPKSVTERGFFQPPISGSARPIDQRRADFINALYNFRLPDTPRVTGTKLPLTIAGQEISAATEPGRVSVPVTPRAPFMGPKAEKAGVAGREILEVNPFRSELEQAAQDANLPMPSLIEAVQRLNLSSIKEAELAPEQPEFRGNTLTLTAGFVPKKAKVNPDHSWLDPNGEFHPAFGDHAYAAKQMTGIANPQDAYFSLLNQGWKRVRREGNTLWASGRGPEPLNRAQRAALESAGIENDLTVKHDTGDAPRTLYTPPTEEVSSQPLALQVGQFVPNDKPGAIKAAAVREKKTGRIFEDVWHAGAQMKAREAGFSNDKNDYEDGFTTNSGEFLNRFDAADRAEKMKQMTPGRADETQGLHSGDMDQFEPARQSTFQFSPSKDPRAIKSAAVRDESGNIYEGVMHGDALDKMPKGIQNWEEGFVTNSGEYLSREQAYERALELRQVTKPELEASEKEAFMGGTPFSDEKKLEATAFKGSRQFSPAQAMDELRTMSNDDFSKLKDFRGKYGGGITGWAYEVGTQAKTPEDLTAFKHARDVALEMGKAAMANKDLGNASNWMSRAMVAREAYEAATGHQIDKPEAEGSALRHLQTVEPGFEPPLAPGKNPVEQVARDYTKSAGIDYTPPTTVSKVDEAKAKELADWYDAAKHEPNNPEVKAAYEAMGKETEDQYRAITAAGYKIEPYKGEGEPYKSSADMVRDVRENKHLYYLQSGNAFGGEDAATQKNLLLKNSDIKINGEPVPYNDLFRAVHDFFGHALRGHQFGAKGELNAWLEHSRMFTPEAQGAVAAETLAQNSWVNFGKHLRNEAGAVPKKGEEGYVAPPQRPFAEQKNLIVPEKFRQFVPSSEEKKARVGTEFTSFFNDVSAGRFGKSDVPFEPEQDLSDVAHVDAERQKYRSNFENHIDKSIPMHYEEKTRKIDGVVKSYPEGARVLDLAGSEGDFGKTISSLSNGKIETVTLDPNEEMAKQFSEKPQVEGATYAKEAWLNGFESGGKEYPAHNPEEPYDLINEAVGFQFIDPDRASQIAEVKRQLKPDGVFLTLEKVKNPQWKENEAFKDKEFKSKYWKNEELKQKETRVGFQQSKAETNAVGMLDNMVTASELEKVLGDNFKNVVQYFDSGNFKGYAASDDAAKLKTVVDNIGDLNSKFSTVETPRTVQMLPKKRQPGEVDVENTDYSKYNVSPAGEKGAPSENKWTLKPTVSGFRKMWILPNGEPADTGGEWHHDWLNQHPDVRERYGLTETDSSEENRVDALKKGFARVNYATNGHLTVEARLADWRKLKPSVEKLVENNLGKVDRMTVTLFNPTASKVADSETQNFLDIPKDERMQNIPFITGSAEPRGGMQFAPKSEDELLPGFTGKTPLASAQLGNMTRKEIADYYPEAVVPASRKETISSDIESSPLAKQAGSREAAVKAFSDKLVEFAKSKQDDPTYQLGAKWYSDFVPALKKEFGSDSPVMAELLAATSPRTDVSSNYAYALDALQGYKSGRFDKQIAKFEQGLEKLNDGSWEKWIEKEIKAGNVEDAPETPSPATFLGHWIVKHDLQPRQSNGALYGTHSTRVLQVLARKWMDMNQGPKTTTFVSNLLGTGHEATIDVWADRTMRRLGYEGYKDRWRILPGNAAPVSDSDFAFSQEAFRNAAKELGMKPDALQGALWFAEKQHWADNGWARLDLGSFQKELEKTSLLRQGIDRRLRVTAAQKKAGEQKPGELGLKIEARAMR